MINLLNHPQAKAILDAMDQDGFEARFVGGCVRDCLLGRKLGDMDMATNALPDQTMKTLKQHGIKVIPTGLDHGTVTAVIDQIPFEITTLRRDVETDGRHAEVAFTDSWEEDARRRDFTINAISVDKNGTLHDYCGGQADIKTKTLRFIDDAEQRIVEDYLRLLRYFRFASQLDWQIEPSAVLSKLAPKLKTLSRERIQSELYKLLMGDGAQRIVTQMHDLKIWDALFDKVDLQRFKNTKTDDAFCRLIALAGWMESVLEQSIVLTREQKKRLQALDNVAKAADHDLHELLYYYGQQAVQGYNALYPTWDSSVIKNWQKPSFPLKAEHVSAIGAELGAILKKSEKYWVDQHFKPDLNALIAYSKT